MGPLLASPAVRLRWPPPGEHAAAGGSASLVPSPRLRAGRRSCRTRAKRGNGITQRAFGPQTTEAVRSEGASPLDADLCYIRRAPRSKYGQSPPWQLRRFPTATKTHRATLFRRALVEVRAVRHARGDLGPLFASPTVRLRLPPSGEHAAAPGSAALIASQDAASADFVDTTASGQQGCCDGVGDAYVKTAKMRGALVFFKGQSPPAILFHQCLQQRVPHISVKNNIHLRRQFVR